MTEPYGFDQVGMTRCIASIRNYEAIAKNGVAIETRFDEFAGRWFRLTAELINDGTTAAVEWMRRNHNGFYDDGGAGEVVDLIGKSWGIAGEVGLAVPWGKDDGTGDLERVMQVSLSPGRIIYDGAVKAGSSIGPNSSGLVVADPENVDVTVHDPNYLPGTVPENALCRFYFNVARNRFDLLDLKDCP